MRLTPSSPVGRSPDTLPKSLETLSFGAIFNQSLRGKEVRGNQEIQVMMVCMWFLCVSSTIWIWWNQEMKVTAMVFFHTKKNKPPVVEVNHTLQCLVLSESVPLSHIRITRLVVASGNRRHENGLWYFYKFSPNPRGWEKDVSFFNVVVEVWLVSHVWWSPLFCGACSGLEPPAFKGSVAW